VCILQKKFLALVETELSFPCHLARSQVTTVTELTIAMKNAVIPPSNSLLPSGYNSLCIMSQVLVQVTFLTHKTTDLTIKLQVRAVVLTWLTAKDNLMLFTCVLSTSLRTASIDCGERRLLWNFRLNIEPRKRERNERIVSCG
jgi:hypothetical protein